MGLLSFLQKKRSADKLEGVDFSPTSDFWYQLIDENRRPAGQVVNATTAQRVAAVYACITAIAESVAMLPAGVYEEIAEQNKEKRKDHYLYGLLRDAPNPWMDSFEFIEMQQRHILSHGNAYAHILRTKSGKIIQLTPLYPEKVDVWMSKDGRLTYKYTEQGGASYYDQKDILHLKNASLDGIVGRSPIKVAADTVGFSLAVQEHGNKTFEQGAFLSGFLEMATHFKDQESRENFMQSFKKYMGSKNSGKWALLEDGVQFKPYSMNNKDAQFLEVKDANAVDIARLFRMPPMMIQAMDKGMTFASVEQLAIMFVQYTIQPWVTRWERALKRQLLTLSGEDSYSIKFNVDALLRGDIKSRTEALVQQLQYGLSTINEARNLLDRNAVDKEVGDEVLLSHNLRPAKIALSEPITGVSANNNSVNVDKNDDDDDENTVTDEKRGNFEPLFNSLLGRLRRRELQALESAKPENFDAWVNEFIQKHRNLVIETLEPVQSAYSAHCREGFELFVRDYIEDLKVQMQKGVDALRNDEIKWADRLLESLEGAINANKRA